MTYKEVEEECEKHERCDYCPYREMTTYGEYACSIRNEDLEK